MLLINLFRKFVHLKKSKHNLFSAIVLLHAVDPADG